MEILIRGMVCLRIEAQPRLLENTIGLSTRSENRIYDDINDMVL
jgi:hypothetical protein